MGPLRFLRGVGVSPFVGCLLSLWRNMAARAPIAKDCADCGLAEIGLEPASSAISRPRTPSDPLEARFRGQ
eukprot:6753323-Alexandrium_andersonii.AAC.1